MNKQTKIFISEDRVTPGDAFKRYSLIKQTPAGDIYLAKNALSITKFKIEGTLHLKL